jgi:hypothetical protein
MESLEVVTSYDEQVISAEPDMCSSHDQYLE